MKFFFTNFLAVMEFNALARLKQYDAFPPNEAPTTQKTRKLRVSVNGLQLMYDGCKCTVTYQEFYDK